MSKVVKFLWILLTFIIVNAETPTIDCKYSENKSKYVIVENACDCEVQNTLDINSLDSATFNSSSGTHIPAYDYESDNNDNVNNFDLYNKGDVNYFPRGLNKIFKNLKIIRIYKSELLEIHSSDLEPFVKLVELCLHSNKIEMPEEGLLDHNPDLEYVVLRENKISYIDPKLFDNLQKLKYLYLEGNVCINVNGINSIQSVKNIIQVAKDACTGSDYSVLFEAIEKVEVESKIHNFNPFIEKVDNLENEIQNSKFSNTFQRRLKKLKHVVKKLELEAETCSILGTKFDNLAAELTVSQELSSINKNLIIVKNEINNVTTITDAKPTNLNAKFSILNSEFTNLSDTIFRINNAVLTVNKTTESLNKRLENLDDLLTSLKSFTYKRVEQMENQMKTDHHGIVLSIRNLKNKLEEH